MLFSKPWVEFVRIDMKMEIATSDCDLAAAQATSSGEDCINSGAPQNNCDDNMF